MCLDMQAGQAGGEVARVNLHVQKLTWILVMVPK